MTQRNEMLRRTFEEALDLPPAARAAFVEQACAGDALLRQEVLELLRCHVGPDSLLDRPAVLPLGFDAVLSPQQRMHGYRILGLLGRGGMGVVYLAERETTGERVALKMLNLASYTPEALARFQREAKVLRQLKHPRIAKYIESGVFQLSEGLLPYLVLEVVDGVPLTRAVERDHLGIDQRIRLLERVCEGVAHAHSLGIVHRDLKPDNILVGNDGLPKILDFGVSRIVDRDDAGVSLATGTGLLLGTPQYMSPEQARGDVATIGPASDVYALGMIAYEMLAGRLPYDATSVSLHRAMVLILTAEPPRLGDTNPALRGDLERVVAMALEKVPGQRYPSAGALAADLERLQSGRRVIARPAGQLQRAVRRAIRHPVRIAIAGTAIGLVVAGLWVARKSGAMSPEETRNALAALYEGIQDADWQLHIRVQTREGLRAVLADLERIRKELARIPVQPFTPDLKRYTLIRSGEAALFLGRIDHDPDLLSEAESYFTVAKDTVLKPGALDLVDSVEMRTLLQGQGFHRPAGLLALGALDIARYRRPVSYLSSAYGVLDWLVSEIASRRARPRFVSESDSVLVYAMTLNDFGETETCLGVATLDAALLQTGLDRLHKAQRTRELEDLGPAQGSLLYNLGRAHLWRAELLRTPADLDSAAHYLEASLVHRGPERRLVYTETQLALCERDLLAAELAPSVGARSVQFEQAIRHLDAAEAVLLPTDHPFDSAAIQSQRAATRIAAAIAGSNPAHLVGVDSLLHRAASVFTRTNYPLQRARLELQFAALGRARALLAADPKAWSEAEAHLRTAHELVPQPQDPRFSHEIDLEAGRVAAASRMDSGERGGR